MYLLYHFLVHYLHIMRINCIIGFAPQNIKLKNRPAGMRGQRCYFWQICYKSKTTHRFPFPKGHSLKFTHVMVRYL